MAHVRHSLMNLGRYGLHLMLMRMPTVHLLVLIMRIWSAPDGMTVDLLDAMNRTWVGCLTALMLICLLLLLLLRIRRRLSIVRLR